MKMKKLTTIALAAAVAIGTFGFSVPANATELPTTTTDYVLTIPASLNVTTAGWNETAGITAKVKDGDTFDTGKKLSVTATSAADTAGKGWSLLSGDNKVGYNLATAEADYSATATAASWEFSATDLNGESGKTLTMGINVDDYSDKPAGTYTDTVTFTAKVEIAKATLADALKTDATITVTSTSNNDETWTATFKNNGSNSLEVTSKKAGDTEAGIDNTSIGKFSANINENKITVNFGYTVNSNYDQTIVFNTTDNTYTHTGGSLLGNVTSVKVNDEEILSDLTKSN